MKILCIGDVVGTPGLQALTRVLPELIRRHEPSCVIVNGENSAPDGRGITPATADDIMRLGASCITTGNHVWAKKEIVPYITAHKHILRPVNFPGGTPGVGATVITTLSGIKVGVLNVMGRVFMREQLDCPFRAAQSAVLFLRSQTPIIVVDMHAETTAEKLCIASLLDGQVSVVVGTHTHVQTADERILPRGTAFMTDLGMCGALHSSIGMKTDGVLQHFMTQMPQKFVVATEGPMIVTGVVVKVDEATGRAQSIARVHEVVQSV